MKKAFLAFLISLASLAGLGQSLTDSVELQSFMDGMMEAHLKDKNLAGAIVSVVKDGKVLLVKGYGYSDVRNQIRVTGDSTLFRVGSISKMFTWISVMQLVAEGKLDLNADINQYLKDFKIADTYPQPITLTNLMTHTPGFEDLVIGLFARDSTSLKPLGTILSNELPARVRPPGTSASYSNHGTGMAAYIVEQKSGTDFNNYVENHILNPLQMHATTFRQPLPLYMRSMMSKGYKIEGNELSEQPFEYVPLYPVGSASTTAADMARFMTMILNHGRFQGVQILDSTTLHRMESPAHRHHPSVNPMRYGFIDASRNGVTVIGHGGDTFWFHSMMALFPESNTGLFVSFNTSEAPVKKVLEEFMDRYFPERNPLKPVIRLKRSSLERFAGSFRVNRYPHNDLTMIASLSGDFTVEAIDSTRLKVSGFSAVRYFVPIDSFTFREEHSSDVVAFKRDERGVITQMFLGDLPILALDRTNLINSGALHTSLFGITVLFILIMLFYWPITSRARRGYEPMGSVVPLPPGAKVIGWFNYFLLAVFYMGLVMTLSDPTSIVYGVPLSLKILLVIPFILILTTVIMYLQLYRIWNQRRYRRWSRVFYFLITMVSTAALWQLYYWHFIGYHY